MCWLVPVFLLYKKGLPDLADTMLSNIVKQHFGFGEPKYNCFLLRCSTCEFTSKQKVLCRFRPKDRHGHPAPDPTEIEYWKPGSDHRDKFPMLTERVDTQIEGHVTQAEALAAYHRAPRCAAIVPL